MRTQPLASRELDDFRLISLLGRGGTGSVWLAEQKSAQRLVALKMLNPLQVSNERARERFRREWQAVGKLDHPNIVPLYTTGEIDGIPYFTMARVDGSNLSDVLQKLQRHRTEDLTGEMLKAAVLGEGSDPAARASHLVDECSIFRRGYVESVCRLAILGASALNHAHERGLVHRDVKPSNILITRQGVPMLLDFGVARDETATALTVTGEFVGSVARFHGIARRGSAHRGSAHDHQGV
jgi:serine/threonine protein kinase